MIIDLSPGRVTVGHRVAGTADDSPVDSPWRNLIVAPRTDEPISSQARSLIVEHLDASGLGLLAEWRELRPTSRWDDIAVRALGRGLAYSARSEEEAAIAELVSRAVGVLEQPVFHSNCGVDLGSWSPVTQHTFDACLVAADRRLIVVVLVVDED